MSRRLRTPQTGTGNVASANALMSLHLLAHVALDKTLVHGVLEEPEDEPRHLEVGLEGQVRRVPLVLHPEEHVPRTGGSGRCESEDPHATGWTRPGDRWSAAGEDDGLRAADQDLPPVLEAVGHRADGIAGRSGQTRQSRCERRPTNRRRPELRGPLGNESLGRLELRLETRPPSRRLALRPRRPSVPTVGRARRVCLCSSRHPFSPSIVRPVRGAWRRRMVRAIPRSAHLGRPIRVDAADAAETSPVSDRLAASDRPPETGQDALSRPDIGLTDCGHGDLTRDRPRTRSIRSRPQKRRASRW